MTTVINIVKAYLIENKFEGLVNGNGNCCCEISNIIPCYQDFSECKPAYKHHHPDGNSGWAMWAQKDPPELSDWERIDH